MKKTTLFVACILCFTGSSNAQFFKKLGKKVEQAAEKTVVRKAERKTSKETEKAFDSTFNNNRKNKRNVNSPIKTKATPAASYAFNHKVAMQIISGKNVMDMDYFLPDSGNFLGAQLKDEKIENTYFTVFDIDKETMFTYMENEGHKMKMAMELKMNEADNEASKFDITATGNTKTILGYNCQEYKMTGEDMTATIWVTDDVSIRFPKNFYKANQDKNNNQAWMKNVDGWAMEMVMIDTSKRKPQTIIMNCISIEKSNLNINSNEYKNMGF